MPPFQALKLSANLLKISLLLALLPGSASAALIFNIDTFTTDQLTIIIPVGPATLDATGTPPTDINVIAFYLIDPDGINNSWILDSTMGTNSGAIGGIGFYVSSSFNNLAGAGDVLYFISNEQPFSAEDTVTSAISITWSGSNAFDPSAVSSLLLTWGVDGFPASYPFGDHQGTTSTAAVPDTGSTASLLGVGVFVLATARRRLG